MLEVAEVSNAWCLEGGIRMLAVEDGEDKCLMLWMCRLVWDPNEAKTKLDFAVGKTNQNLTESRCG